MSDPLPLLQGTLDLLVLQTLKGGPRHGYGVATQIRDRTRGTLQVEDAALYQALHRLERKGFVEADWGVSENNRRAKFYRLCSKGERKLAAEASRWERYSDAVFRVLRPGES